MVISHLHADHFLDLVPYSYALTYAPRQQPVPVHTWPGTDNPARPALHAPPGARETFRRVVGAWGNEDLIENAFDLARVRPRRRARHRAAPDPVPARCPHFTETFAMSISVDRPAAGRSDLRRRLPARPSDLVEFAKGAEPDAGGGHAPAPGARRHARPPHLGARRASTRAPPVPRGSCSCTSRTSSIPSGRAAQAAETFGGPVEVAARGRRLRGLTGDEQPAASYSREPWPAHGTSSPTSIACGARSTSCSATSSSAPPACAAAASLRRSTSTTWTTRRARW